MFIERVLRSRLFSVGLALVAVVAALALPLPARAETPLARVTLYEVNEALRLKAVRHDDTSELKRRLAQASLQGPDVGPPATNTDFGPTATTSVPSSEACANRRHSSDVSSWRTSSNRSPTVTA